MSSIFTVGFNPKTTDLLSICFPINFRLNEGLTLNIDGHAHDLNAEYPDDAGIIQKTFYKQSNIPVFILAGLGTMGTETAGIVLNEKAIQLGKLYGNDSFCILFKTDITRGNKYYEIKGIFPKPQWYRAIWYPTTYFKWWKRKIFPSNV